jgi:hypothetical protein
VNLSSSIKALIRQPTFTPGSQPYKITAAVLLKATMPGLNRLLDNFEYPRPFDIQYPLEVQEEINYLPSVSQGPENKISMQISNRSNQIFGLDRASSRRAEVRISIVSEVGSLLSLLGIWSPEVSHQVPQRVPANSICDMLQLFQTSNTAKDHTYTKIHVEFLISSAGPVPASRSPMRLVQSFDLKMVISAAYRYDEEAVILVVTNVKTSPELFEVIGDFICNELRPNMDVWNVSTYGGLI